MAFLGNLRGNLFRKYIVIIVTLVGVGLMMSGLIDIYFMYQQTKAAQVQLNQAKAKAAAAKINQFVKEIEHQIGWATHYPWDTSPAGLNQRRLDSLRLLRQVPAITEIGHLDPSGMEQLRVSRLAIDVVRSQADFSQEPKFLEVKAQDTYFSPVYFRDGSEPYMTIAVAMQGQPRGVVVAEVNLGFVWDVVSEIKVGESGYAYFVDSSGVLVSHPDISLVLQKTDLSSLAQVKSALVRSANSDGPQPEEVAIARDIQGRRVLTTSNTVGTLGWHIFVEQPLNEAFAPLYSSIFRTVLLLLVGLILSVFTSFVLAYKMVTPVRQLQAGAARIGAGDLDQLIDVHTGDELEDLANEFNQMTARLRESHTSLEQEAVARGVAYAELERKRSQLEETQEQLLRTEKLAAVGQLAGGVAHDLRNPLGAINNAIFYLKRKLDTSEEVKANPRVGQFLNIIGEEVAHSNNIITDLLTFSRLGALSYSPVHLGEIIEKTLSSVELGKQIHVIKEFDSNLPEVNADCDQLQRVFANMILNAQEAMPAGGDLTITTRTDNEFAAVTFRDTGLGMTDDVLKNIFQPLFTTKLKGTGFGLAICQQVVAKHEGIVDVVSKEGEGTAFTIKLPLTGNGQG